MFAVSRSLCRRGTFFAAVLLAGLTFPPPAAAENLVENSDFNRDAAGWTPDGATGPGVTLAWSGDGGRDGSGALRVAVAKTAEAPRLAWKCRLAQPCGGQRIRAAAWLRGKDCAAGPVFRAHAWDAERLDVLAFAAGQAARPLKGDFEFTRVELTLAVPREAAAVEVSVVLLGAGEVWLDDVTAEAAGPATAEELRQAASFNAGRPGIFRCRGEYQIHATPDWQNSANAGERGPEPAAADQDKARRIRRAPKLLLPLPLNYREQVPLTYELTVEPPERLESARLYEDRPGNWVAEVVLKPLEDGPASGDSRPNRAAVGDAFAELRWTALVLAAPRAFDDFPKQAALPDAWPVEARPWLRATKYAEADDPNLRTVARELRGDSNDVPRIIRRTLARLREIQRRQKGRCAALGAAEALEKQGSCTSNANLAAALLRANGIPARILAGYPSWSGPLQTHYTVEAWVPGYGWYPLESTLTKAPWPPSGQIQVAILPPEYEDQGGLRGNVAPGVPYLSLTEYVDYDRSWIAVGNIGGKLGCDHVAEQAQIFADDTPPADWQAALDAARRKWDAWLRGDPKPVNGRLTTPTTAKQLETAKTAADVRRAFE